MPKRFPSFKSSDSISIDAAADCCTRLQAIGFDSNLPVVIVDTRGVIPSRDKIRADLCTCGSPEHGDYAGNVRFNIRGGQNSQRRNQLFQYAVKMGESDNFLGMPKRKNWILHAQQLDPFSVKNWLGFNLSRGTGEYASSTQFAELFIVDDSTALEYPKHYWGVYLGLQKITQGKNAVDITDTNETTQPEQSSFILEFEHGQNYKNESTIAGPVTYKPWNIKYPKDNVPAQVDFLQGVLDNFERALYSPDFADPVLGWRRYANETAMAHWFITQELAKNAKHSYHSAAWMHKDSGKPLAMGPCWNTVQGFGTCCGYPITGYLENGTSGPGISGGSAISPNGWLFNICLEPERCQVLEGYDAQNGIALWFVRLWQDPAWRSTVSAGWTQLRAGPWQESTIQAALDATQIKLAEPAQRALQKWGGGPLQYVQYDELFDRLSTWLMSRLQWLDGAFALAAAGPASAPFPAAFPPSNLPAALATAG
ncbi:hypothetical protein WJX73_006542 [Symbiochloris irregularis]|uniref:Uncharacterized protein n=1 Tax=Symbiochloris irregularis TaxID=706552 RepID=A0AAW1P1Y6_9CHLO